MLAKNTTFGVEIECYIPKAHANSFPRGNYHKGLQIPDYPTGWNAQKDSSLAIKGEDEYIDILTFDGQEYFGCEIVSPVLKGEKGLLEVWAVCNDLQQMGAIVKSRCGLHIHVGAKSLLEDGQIGKLVSEFRQFESVFFALNGENTPDRLNNKYCKNSKSWVAIETDRYQSLNITNLNKNKKTVEFRMFAGTINPELIVTAAYMCVSMVSSVSQNKTAPTGNLGILDKTRAFASHYWGQATNLILSDIDTQDVQNTLFNQVSLAVPYFS